MRRSVGSSAPGPFDEASRFAKGLLGSRFLAIAEITPPGFERALDRRLVFRDRPDISFTVLTSSAVLEELRSMDILTADRHFLQTGLGFRAHRYTRET
jgi:hypothetical protein